MLDLKSIVQFVDMVLWEGVDVLTGGLMNGPAVDTGRD